LTDNLGEHLCSLISSPPFFFLFSFLSQKQGCGIGFLFLDWTLVENLDGMGWRGMRWAGAIFPKEFREKWMDVERRGSGGSKLDELL
jgi:hypothetical protein